MQYGLIGMPLGHSFSKDIHSLIADYSYETREIEASSLEEFLKKKEFCAINVTIPYKQAVIPYLDEIEKKALKIGAINTVVNENGRLIGYNTDYYGLKSLMEFANIDVKNKKVLILGSGGTSKTAHTVCEDMSARAVFLVSRKGGNGFITYEDAIKYHNDAEIIINTTPVGMFPGNDSIPIDLSHFNKLYATVDAVYNPLRTRLVLDCQKRGVKSIGGLYMLVAQAVFASALFLKKEADTSLICKTYKKLLTGKENIVLTGMPCSGKTSVGEVLAKRLNKSFIDTDVLIEQKIGMSISSFFEKNGETAFRNIESEVIEEIKNLNGCVIATGGGAILREKNVENLKHNGRLFFLDRPLERLFPTEDRPLSSDIKALQQRYNERYGIYLSTCDKRINNDKDILQAVNEIIKELSK